MKITGILFCAMWLTGFSPTLFCSDDAPWGGARASDVRYQPQKVLYDLTSGNEQAIINILDRVSYLGTLYESDPFDMAVVIVVHGDAVPFFARKNYGKYRDTVARAQSLTVGNGIEFRMCQAAARLQGLAPGDIHGFITMVPMADAEIVRLQREEGYAYLQ
jgi:intracellular sulfur oxidation DsrE/DsrF family protein